MIPTWTYTNRLVLHVLNKPQKTLDAHGYCLLETYMYSVAFISIMAHMRKEYIQGNILLRLCDAQHPCMIFASLKK